MAYGKKYITSWYSQIQEHYFRAEIWQDGYSGEVIEVEASDNAASISWETSDNNLLNPIKSLQADIAFLSSESFSLSSFYSNTDQSFRLDIYCDTLHTGEYANKLLFTGFIIQDESGEEWSDIVHYIQLKATDNIGLLKDITLDKCTFSSGTGTKKRSLT